MLETSPEDDSIWRMLLPFSLASEWHVATSSEPRSWLVLQVRTAVVLLFACFSIQPTTHAQVKEIRRVLILNDLGIVSSPGFAEVDRAVFDGLQGSPYQIELYHESLELTLFPDEASQRRFREGFVLKYSDRRPDVIITVGSASFQFIADLREPFVRDTPVIFCAILGEIPDQTNSAMHFTGVLGKLHPEETLKAALQLLPRTQHVVVVGGMGPFDAAWEAIAKESFRKYESKLQFTYLIDLSMPALLERLKQLPSNTMVYHTAITGDAAGNRFIDSAQSVPLVVSAAKAPVFVMDDVDFRAGAVGGDLVNWADDGRAAAAMAVRVLNGERPEAIPIVTSNHNYLFDWRAMQHWGMNASDLPPGSIVRNRPPNFWQVYKRYILAGFFVILAQALAILGLLRQRARRRASEIELADSNDRLRLAMEMGRSVGWEWNMANGRNSWFGDLLSLFGMSSDSFAAKDGDFYRYVHCQDKERVSKAVAHAKEKRAPFNEEFRLVLPDGTTRWIVSRGRFEYDNDGEATRMLGMAVDITERKEAEQAISSVSRRLIEAQEEERAWIARELHDDITQRIALLSVNLSAFAQNPRLVEATTSLKMEEITEELTGLGSDVQALSHRLHSSKLDYLGLAAAAAGFCNELSERQSVQIEFHSDNIPRDLSKEISLCVFRVLQEALQNGVKHSGVRKFFVSLVASSGNVEMSVHDSGAGFDPAKAINGHGLGLMSMKERLKLVHGQLSIDSKQGHGTTIYARVPLKVTVANG